MSEQASPKAAAEAANIGERARAGALLLAGSMAVVAWSSGCAVRYPARWNARDQATSQIVRWTAQDASPDASYEGELIRIDMRRWGRPNALQTFQTDIAFSASFAAARDVRIYCYTPPAGPGAVRFTCLSARAGEPAVRFWLAPEQICGDPFWRLDSRCWQGTLEIGDDRIQLSNSTWESLGTPAAYHSWIDDQGELVLAAQDEFWNRRSVRFFDPRDPAGEPFAAFDRRRLLLVSVALILYQHLSSPHDTGAPIFG